MHIFELSELDRQRADEGKAFFEFLRVPPLSLGIYTLAAGASDPQSPHTEDEAYYIVAGLARYGGDDGLTIQKRSQFIAPINLSNKVQFYYICLVLLCAAIYLVWRIVNSRFGMAIQGARSNDTRMRAIGFPTYRYKLVCFVIAGTLCGLAGALLANHTDFVSPAMMYWTRSGDLIIMVVLGGMGSTFGPLFGAVALLVLEEVLSGITEYWQIILGPLLLLVVLFARGGIDGLLGKAPHG